MGYFSRSWTVLFSRLTFPGFCTRRRLSSGWPRFFPSGGRGCVVQLQLRHLVLSPQAVQEEVWHELWLQQGKGSVLRRRWWWPILPPRNALVLFSLFEGRRFALLIQQDGGSVHEGAQTPHQRRRLLIIWGTTIDIILYAKKTSHGKSKIASQQPIPLWFRKSNFEWTQLASKECTILLEFNKIQIHGIETSTLLQRCP